MLRQTHQNLLASTLSSYLRFRSSASNCSGLIIKLFPKENASFFTTYDTMVPKCENGIQSFIRTMMINHKILRYSISWQTWQTHMWLGCMTGEKIAKHIMKHVTPVILYQLHLQVLWFEWDINHPTSVNIPSINRRVYDAIWITLVGGWAYPSEKWWSSSVGTMTVPIYGKKSSKPPTRTVELIYLVLTCSQIDLYWGWMCIEVLNPLFHWQWTDGLHLEKTTSCRYQGVEYMFSPLVIQHSSLVCSLVQITLW